MENLNVVQFKDIKGLLQVPIFNPDAQMSFGGLIESNLTKAISAYGEAAYCSMVKTSKAEDVLFGADFKILFEKPGDQNIDGLSTYVDITINPGKEKLGLFIIRNRKEFSLYQEKEEQLLLMEQKCSLV